MILIAISKKNNMTGFNIQGFNIQYSGTDWFQYNLLVLNFIVSIWLTGFKQQRVEREWFQYVSLCFNITYLMYLSETLLLIQKLLNSVSLLDQKSNICGSLSMDSNNQTEKK